jgi:predicted metal-binding membrane protein
MPMAGGVTLSAITSFMETWVAMMAAMMLPPLVPALARYRRSFRASGVRGGTPTALVGAGYYLVWSAVGLVAYFAGVAVAALEQSWPGFAPLVPVATGIVLLAAGLLQLTAWKQHHLARCRECASTGSADAWDAGRHGVRLGMECVLCCTGFMTVLLVTGMMRLGTIALVAAAITLERVAPWPERTARALGAVILAVGALTLARGLGMF